MTRSIAFPLNLLTEEKILRIMTARSYSSVVMRSVILIIKIFIFLCRPDRYFSLLHLPPYPSIDLPLHPGEQERDVETAAVPAAETRQPGQLVVEA